MFMSLDVSKQFLGCIGQVVVVGQPAVVDAVEAVASLNLPIASSFPHSRGKQDIQLTVRWDSHGPISAG